MEDLLSIIQRREELFGPDMARAEDELRSQVRGASFLVVGGAGSIGRAVVREIFSRGPRCLHVVDLSENNLVELVRDMRSSLGYIEGDFRALPLDCGTGEFDAFVRAHGPYDYVLNLSALKHVRSEKDPFTLMRMVVVNVVNTDRLLGLASEMRSTKFFAVSTDKAVSPVNAMGATKRAMEMCLFGLPERTGASAARFANVAFSDGSLLHGFTRRIALGQPISAPRDVRRYFMTTRESGQLCLLSCLLGESGDILVPKIGDRLKLIDFPAIARSYLASLGYEPFECADEDEARARAGELIAQKRWPCYFFETDTTGEKPFEEFFAPDEEVDLARFDRIAVVRARRPAERGAIDAFLRTIDRLRRSDSWDKAPIIDALGELLGDFDHVETHKYLDGRM